MILKKSLSELDRPSFLGLWKWLVWVGSVCESHCDLSFTTSLSPFHLPHPPPIHLYHYFPLPLLFFLLFSSSSSCSPSPWCARRLPSSRCLRPATTADHRSSSSSSWLPHLATWSCVPASFPRYLAAHEVTRARGAYTRAGGEHASSDGSDVLDMCGWRVWTTRKWQYTRKWPSLKN